jgi:hypothetical protein
MAEQKIIAEVTQRCSGGPISVHVTYTSDGVVVKKTVKRLLNRQEGCTLDNMLVEQVRLSVVARVTGWLQQTRMF